MTIYPVILCGGTGTRLWPLSRQSMPKQFQKLWSEWTCFQETVRRVSTSAYAEPLVVTGYDYRFVVAQQLEEIDASATILLEPEGRNSGPAILSAATLLMKRDPDALMLVLAADHWIDDAAAFNAAVERAAGTASDNRIVVFGIQPSKAATEYGYIEPGEPIGDVCQSVKSFVEKPDAETAASYVKKGFLWNSGNFLFSIDTIIKEYRNTDPDTLRTVNDAVERASTDLDFIVLDCQSYGRTRSQSIDYAVMEKTTAAAVVPVTYRWSDVGSWQSLWELGAKSENGNVTQGPVLSVDSKDCYVNSERGCVTATLGTQDLLVVATKDAVLVADRSLAGSVGKVVDRLGAAGFEEAFAHKRKERPWGWYETLSLAPRYQIKRIVVYPGGRLSLQKHFHRHEHWVVVRGSALATIDEKTSLVSEGESIYVPLGSVHRLENQGKIDLEIVEVQTGSYLGEDDIVRFDDVYGRTELK